MAVNNVNLVAMQESVEEMKKNPTQAKKVKQVGGQWVFQEGEPQFRAEVEFPKGKEVLQADFPPFLGGGGLKPDPIQYCLYGLAACFAGIFAAVAAMEGVDLKKLSVVAESKLDFSRVFGLTDNPPVEGIELTVTVSSDAAPEKIQEIDRLARERCPGVYCITNPIPLKTKLIRK